MKVFPVTALRLINTENYEYMLLEQQKNAPNRNQPT
jgi:hypothetical protein